MKISEAWLREWVNPQVTTDELCAQLTMAGLEVDGVEKPAGEFSGVIVGEIVACEQHPDAEKLRVCQVNGHPDGTMQVVCGAPNARIGIKIPFATIGAQLPGDFKIKKAKLRGVESFGMLCGQTELEAGPDDSGVWELPAEAPVGKDLREYLQLNDSIIEVDLTPNRSDCLSVKGIAREVGVLNRTPVTYPAISSVKPSIEDTLPVSLHAEKACSRYVGRVIRNVDISKPSPAWLQDKLQRAGIRSIDAVVDVTNYILTELGQPMHAFDLSALAGGIVIRMAEEGEKLVLLDGQEVSLKSNTMVIADHDKALAIAGVMGGKASSVSENTRDIFLESAFFDPVSIAGRARQYGLHTDSSHRFERGVDYNLQVDAIERATELLVSIVGGEVGPLVHEINDYLPTARKVQLRKSRIVSGLSLDIRDSEVLDILTRLGLMLESQDDLGWTFIVPSYRFDISIEVDLLEELARVYGYNRLPTRSLAAPISIEARPEVSMKLSSLTKLLIGRGFQEAITYSFIEPKLSALFDASVNPVALRNPISADMAVMRTSLLPGLVSALKNNLNRQQTRASFFETGLRFVPSEQGLIQEPMIAGLIYGTREPEGWANDKTLVDFYDIKSDVEAIIGLGGSEAAYRFVAAQHPSMHPGQTAAVYKQDVLVGYVGALHPSIVKQLDIVQSVYVFELAQKPLLDGAIPSFSSLSKFPEVRRDLALLVDRALDADTLLFAIKEQAGENLREATLFDVYMGKGIDPQRKSVAVGLTFQHPSRTLNEDEITASIDNVIKHLEAQFSATLR